MAVQFNFSCLPHLCLGSVLFLTLLSCGPENNSTPTSENTPSTSAPENMGSQTRLVDSSGIAAWDALDASEQDLTKTFSSFFLHQSVGGDLEDGAEVLGYKFEYADSDATELAVGLNGGLFKASNGDPAAKINEFRDMALAHKEQARVAIMKFGYADIVSDTLEIAKTQYQTAIADLKAAGIRIVHLTPPLVYSLPSDNHPKMQMRQWMLDTFKDDVIFDLQSLESTDPSNGARCEREGAWEICESIRSTSACPSLNQGVDAPTGQGHLCHSQAQRLAKAFLYAIYLAGK